MKLFNSLCRLPQKSSFGSSSSFGSKIVLGLIATLVSFFINSSPAFAQTVTTTIRAVTPGQLSPAIVGVVGGRQMPVQIRVDNISDSYGLSAFAFKLKFDSNIISVADANNDFIVDTGTIALGSFLGSSGRQVQCGDGDISVDKVDKSKKYLSLTCVTLGRNPAGPTGNGVLATINFITGNTVTNTPLIFDKTQMVNTNANIAGIVHTSVNANVLVVKCANVDGSLNGIVTVSDILAVVSHYGLTDPTYDLDGDGRVTVNDILIAVRQYFQKC